MEEGRKVIAKDQRVNDIQGYWIQLIAVFLYLMANVNWVFT